MEEVREAIKSMANNKSSGIDNCTAEVLKCLDEENLNEIAKILTNYWQQERVPDEMTKARVVSLYKKGNPRMQSNYRPISLLNAMYKIYAKIVKYRMATIIDGYITETQYGFRKSRSTAQAIHVVRRIADYAEMGCTEMNMLLLDWEKAFDRVYHEKLLESLRRLRIPEKIVKVVESLYENPEFIVEINGAQSNTKKQKRGIRQGCPLSPYLFVLVMTALLHDVHWNTERRTDYPDGIDFGEVLYADDTILIGKDAKKVQRVLQRIEEISKTYGLALNKDKCVHLRINNRKRVKFKDGKQMPTEEDTTYLGAQLNSKCDITKDLNMKMGGATHIWRKLDKLWKGTNNRIKDKLNIYI